MKKRTLDSGTGDWRTGDWFVTFTGRKFWPLDPRPDEICIEDIAHALSNICRFGGHVREFYSVAQHSVFVAHLVPRWMSLIGLMHDATEAYLGDMVKPLKLNMPDYRLAERNVWRAICEKFELPENLHPEIKHADNVMLLTERRDLGLENGNTWAEDSTYAPLETDYKIVPVSPEVAEQEFLDLFHKLTAAKQTEPAQP